VFGGPFTVLKSGISSTSYVDASAQNGTTYYYVVSANAGTAESLNSLQAQATPEVPPTGCWSCTESNCTISANASQVICEGPVLSTSFASSTNQSNGVALSCSGSCSNGLYGGCSPSMSTCNMNKTSIICNYVQNSNFCKGL